MVYSKLLLAASSLLVCGLTFSQSLSAAVQSHSSDARTAGPRFSELDKNHDGFLNRDEATAYPKLFGHFDMMDTDKDDRLSKEELLATRQTKSFRHIANRLDDRIKAADNDGDGMLSKEEASTTKLQYVADNFEQFDSNKDGKVSRDELRSTLMGHIRSK